MHSFREYYLFSLFMAQSFLRQFICDQQQDRGGLSVMTNVYISSPRTAVPFFSMAEDCCPACFHVTLPG